MLTIENNIIKNYFVTFELRVTGTAFSILEMFCWKDWEKKQIKRRTLYLEESCRRPGSWLMEERGNMILTSPTTNMKRTLHKMILIRMISNAIETCLNFFTRWQQLVYFQQAVPTSCTKCAFLTVTKMNARNMMSG